MSAWSIGVMIDRASIQAARKHRELSRPQLPERCVKKSSMKQSRLQTLPPEPSGESCGCGLQEFRAPGQREIPGEEIEASKRA